MAYTGVISVQFSYLSLSASLARSYFQKTPHRSSLDRVLVERVVWEDFLLSIPQPTQIIRVKKSS